jgi:hypothetical protein
MKRILIAGITILTFAAVIAAVNYKPNFESLSVANRDFVVHQHDEALTLYRSGRFEESLREVRKIFEVTQNYRDSREIERYARLELQRRAPAGNEARLPADAAGLSQPMATSP